MRFSFTLRIQWETQLHNLHTIWFCLWRLRFVSGAKRRRVWVQSAVIMLMKSSHMLTLYVSLWKSHNAKAALHAERDSTFPSASLRKAKCVSFTRLYLKIHKWLNLASSSCSRSCSSRLIRNDDWKYSFVDFSNITVTCVHISVLFPQMQDSSDQFTLSTGAQSETT